jgi:lysophospholipase L1-like esterase
LLSDFRPFQKNLVRNESAYVVDATGGHSSIQILRDIAKNPGVKDADLAIVSVGTNDVVNQPVNTYYSPAQITENLRKIRTSLNANRYLWVLPYDTQARQLVLSVARQFGDSAIDLADFRKADRYHPADYRQIVRSLNPVIQQALGTDAPDRLAVAGLPGGGPAWPSTASVLRARHSTE